MFPSSSTLSILLLYTSFNIILFCFSLPYVTVLMILRDCMVLFNHSQYHCPSDLGVFFAPSKCNIVREIVSNKGTVNSVALRQRKILLNQIYTVQQDAEI
jgi:hypothetical protein